MKSSEDIFSCGLHRSLRTRERWSRQVAICFGGRRKILGEDETDEGKGPCKSATGIVTC
jgi:hypothetical protein